MTSRLRKNGDRRPTPSPTPPSAPAWARIPSFRAGEGGGISGGEGGGRAVWPAGPGPSPGAWRPRAPVLQDRHRVIAVDLPGFGDSPRLPGWPSSASYAGAVAEAMADARVSAAHIAGLSLGGWGALHFGRDLPQRALSLTLVNAFGSLRVRP